MPELPEVEVVKRSLINKTQNLIKQVNLSLKKQLLSLPKKKIASQSLKNFGLSILEYDINKPFLLFVFCLYSFF